MVCGVIASRFIAFSRLRKFAIIELAEHGAADRGAKCRQAIADFESGGKHPRRAAAGDEHDLVAIEQRERGDFLRCRRDPSSTGCSTVTT